MKKLQLSTCAAVAAAVLILGASGSANAAIIDLGSTGPFSDVTDVVPGVTTLTWSPSDTDTKLVTDPQFGNDFIPANSTQVGLGIQTVFGLSTAPTFISSPGNAGPGTFTAASPFNFAAVHQGQTEFVFYYATPQTSITLGALPGDTLPTLSTINFYSGVAAVPEPATWGMMLLGFAGFGFAFRQSRRKVSFA